MLVLHVTGDMLNRHLAQDLVFVFEEKPHSVFLRTVTYTIPLVDALISAGGKAIKLIASQRDQDHPVILRNKGRLSMTHNVPLVDCMWSSLALVS